MSFLIVITSQFLPAEEESLTQLRHEETTEIMCLNSANVSI